MVERVQVPRLEFPKGRFPATRHHKRFRVSLQTSSIPSVCRLPASCRVQIETVSPPPALHDTERATISSPLQRINLSAMAKITSTTTSPEWTRILEPRITFSSGSE